jgi:hypothetical protein
MWRRHRSNLARAPCPLGRSYRELRSREECAHAPLTSDSHTDDNGVFSARGSSDAGRVR